MALLVCRPPSFMSSHLIFQGPAAVAVLVVHNKLKKKKGVLPNDVTYIAGDEVDDVWNW
jgi:hypothetical protein